MSGPKPLTKRQAVEKALKEAKCVGSCLIRTTRKSVSIGYKCISAEGREFYAHRLVYETVTGECIKGKVIRHSCDNPACINPDHLFSGTHLDNVRDRTKKGRTPAGEKHYNSLLTTELVSQLRKMLHPNFNTLSIEWGISVGALKSAYYGHTWKHL